MENKTDKRLVFEFSVIIAVFSIFLLAYIGGIAISFLELGQHNAGAWIATIGLLVSSFGSLKGMKIGINGIKFAKTFNGELMKNDWEKYNNGLWLIVIGNMISLIGCVLGIYLM